MVAVFLGKGVNSAFRQTVLKILREKINVFEISENHIEKNSGNSELTVIFKNAIKSLHIPNAAIFLNKNQNTEISGERHLIFNSSNPF